MVLSWAYFGYREALLFASSGALVLWCFGALVLWCFGALVLWCFGALVLWCFGALVLIEPFVFHCCLRSAYLGINLAQ